MTRVIVFYSTSRLHAEMFKPIIEWVGLEANSLRLVQNFSEAIGAIRSNGADVIILDGDSMLGEWQNLGRVLYEHSPIILQIMVLFRDRRSALLRYLKNMRLRGAFDVLLEGHKELREAIQCMCSGGSYWSLSLIHQLLCEITVERKEKTQLTAFEDEVMSVIGSGLDDSVASEILGVSASTIASTRKVIHRKLRIKQRSELISFAISKGYCDVKGSIIIPTRHNSRPKRSGLPA